jgi:drug/metabolite transporter (DMT)-like permease
MTYLIALLCVVGIAAGQIFFKLSARSLQQTNSFLHIETLKLLIPALIIYGITTLAWIWVLQKIELGRAYPLMALAFVLVPIGSYFVLGERFNSQYFFGVLVLIVGIILTVRA